MNILLVWPKMSEGFWAYPHVIWVMGKRAVHPPLGLITVADLLPRDWNQRLVDLNITQLTDADLAWADIVFISAMVSQEQSAQEVISRCKRAGAKIAAGGPLFHFRHHRLDAVDHLILNEAELTLPLFLRDLRHNAPKSIYTIEAYADLSETSIPRWELLDLQKYAIMDIQSSRGCPYHCEFCSIAGILGRKFRRKSSQQVINEMSNLYQLGWKGLIYFCDDNFVGNRKFLKTDLLPAISTWRENKKDIFFATSASIDLADDPELMDLMARVGFESVFVGIETMNEEGLKETGKVQNLERDLMASVKNIQRAGLEVSAGFIVGFDHDTPDIFSQLLSFIQISGIAVVQLAPLNAREGSDLFKRLKKEKRILKERYFIDFTSGETNFIPKMGTETLQDGFRQIIRTIYSADNYCARVKLFLEEIKSPPIRISPFLYGFLPIVKALYILLIKDKDRKHYGKLLFWTLWNRPAMIGKILKLAVVGVNFRKLVDDRIPFFS